MATGISIPGGSGAPPLIFTVTGTSTTNYAVAFESAVNSASVLGSLTVNVLSGGPGVSQSAGPGTTLNEIFSNSNGTDTYTLNNGGEYTLALVGDATTITGSAAGNDTVVAAANVTFVEVGGGENVDFIAGDNHFVGDAAGGDTITGGSGYDTIDTGTGNATVFSGAGHTLINLNDSVAGNGDIAYLGDGTAFVNADGLSDTVATGTNGQTIVGGNDTLSAGGTLVVSIADNSVSSGPANDQIVGGAATTDIFDSVGGNQIFGGSGDLTFVGLPNSAGFAAADTILAGSGATAIFGADGTNLDFATASGSGSIVVVAGTGNETLNGANAGDFNFFAGTDSTAAATNLLAVGGSGTDYFSTGIGEETFVAGSGTDVFGINTVGGGGATIQIYDFGGADSISLSSSEQSAASNGTENAAGTGYVITLSDNTTVTFYGVTSLTGHVI